MRHKERLFPCWKPCACLLGAALAGDVTQVYVNPYSTYLSKQVHHLRGSHPVKQISSGRLNTKRGSLAAERGKKSTSRRFGLDSRHLGRGPGVWNETRTDIHVLDNSWGWYDLSCGGHRGQWAYQWACDPVCERTKKHIQHHCHAKPECLHLKVMCFLLFLFIYIKQGRNRN